MAAKKMRGYLYKKSTQLLVGWQKRFWIISGMNLVYFADEALGNEKGSFNVAEMSQIEPAATK